MRNSVFLSNAVRDTFKLSALTLALMAAGVASAAAPVTVRYDKSAQQLVAAQDGREIRLPATDTQLEAHCVNTDAAGNQSVFLVAEEGIGAQWFIADAQGLLPQPLLVRRLALPPAATQCAVDQGTLYVDEENVGIWAYPADAESALERRPVLLQKPWGSVDTLGAFTALDGQLLLHVPDSDTLQVYAPSDDGAFRAVSTLQMPELEGLDVEGLAVNGTRSDGMRLVQVDADEGRFEIAIPWTPAPAANTAVDDVPVITVTPSVQTEPVARLGDAADDPAIWVHPTLPSQSRVLGTDKQGGLQVYDLEGRRLQDLRVGRLNNVDLRDGVMWRGQRVAVAAASNRDNESLHLFTIDAKGDVAEAGEVRTAQKEIYGLCMGRGARGEVYVIANQKDGQFVQYQLRTSGRTLDAVPVRRFALNSQPEGCAVNDRTGDLFVGEEATGVYRLPLDPKSSAGPQPVLKVGPHLKKDVEGMAIYHGTDGDLLVVSSQGNDRYVLLDAKAPYRVRGIVQVAAAPREGIDGASETDGLDVTSANLGGEYAQGVLVVHDGRKRMPETPQNFKYVPWSRISEALKNNLAK